MNSMSTKGEDNTMLTKSLLKFTVRKQKVYPKFIDPKDLSVQTLIADLMKVYNGSSGKTVSALQEDISRLKSQVNPLFDGLNKLLLDRVESSSGEDSETIINRRLALVEEAQSLRQEKPFESLQEFYEELESRMNVKASALQKNFYADLPECQIVNKFESIENLALAHRYNCAQIQGLLIYAHSMKITLRGAPLSFKRYLLRQTKFHRLLVHVLENDRSNFSCELSGPLSVFSSRQTYSLRLANFFPHVLHADSWEMSATMTVKQKKVDLFLDSSTQIKSHYSLKEPYIPKELLSFLEKFNKKQKKWKAEVSEDFVNLGQKHFCFPDVRLSHEGGNKLSLELFHKWHLSQLVDRLRVLSTQKEQSLILGCCESLLGKKEVKDILAKNKKIEKNLLFFKEFPTSTKILKFLENYG